MRVSYLLFVLAATLLAKASATTELSSLVAPDAVPAIQDAHVAAATNRFLRNHPVVEEEEDSEEEVQEDSEERGKADKIMQNAIRSWTKSKTTADDLLSKRLLNMAMQSETRRKALFRGWNKAPKEVRNAAVVKLASDDVLGVKYKKIVDAWNRWGGRKDAGVGFGVFVNS